ncbi:MAG: hypothetical protein IJR89_05485 [Clostridia bacterium]|nr:hypothetical protein [Clostridia bacterium]
MKLESIFTNGAVLQRGMPIRVFGTGEGRAVIRLAGRSAEAEAENGRWCATLPPMEAGGPYTMEADLNGEKTVLTDLYVGEVFLVSGQSNAEMPLFRCDGGFEAAKCAAADAGGIRLYTSPRRYREGEAIYNRHFESTYSEDAVWQTATEENALHFSGLGFYFALFIREKLGVPVGVISCNWGGRPIRTFIPTERFTTEPALREDWAVWQRCCAKYGDEEYETLYRTYIEQMAEFCRYSSHTFENTKRYGHLFAYAADGQRPRPAGFPYGKYSSDRPGGIWETMVSHLVPYGIRAVLWYQGETDSRSRTYFERYDVLLRSWREAFLQPKLPFYAVELAPFLAGTPDNPQSDTFGFPFLREQQQRAARELPDNYLACITDCGDPYDIHPHDKRTPALRLARLVFEHTFGMPNGADAPCYESHRFEDGRAVITFAHVKQFLAWGPVRGLMLAGEDGVFHPAKAEITGAREITASTPKVPRPKYVRFAFLRCPEPCYVYSETGLPIHPFRTDDLDNACHVED